MDTWCKSKKVLGLLDNGSSDLEFGNASITGDPQLVGLRFGNITIPKGSFITRAYIQFTVDATNKNTDPCEVTIRAENSDNPVTYNTADTFNLTKRPKIADSVKWNVSPLVNWTPVGRSNDNQKTADIKLLVQSIVNRDGFVSGNATAFYLSGNGTCEVESFFGDAPKATLLVIEYVSPITVSSRVNDANDDLEEFIAGANQTKVLGLLDNGSSDLELGNESVTGDPQMVGMHLTTCKFLKVLLLVKHTYSLQLMPPIKTLTHVGWL